MSTFKYHAATFHFLGDLNLEPKKNSLQLAEWESRSGHRLPESVSEFLACENIVELVGECTDDRLIPPSLPRDAPAAGFGRLQIAEENQGVVRWFVRLDSGDDPPVWDDDGDIDGELSEISWQRCAESFSAFVFDWITTGKVDMSYEGATLAAGSDPITSWQYGQLCKEFCEGPRDTDPIKRRYCRADSFVTISVATSQDEPNEQARWRIASTSADGLMEVFRSVYGIVKLRNVAVDEAFSGSVETGHAVLRRLSADGLVTPQAKPYPPQVRPWWKFW